MTMRMQLLYYALTLNACSTVMIMKTKTELLFAQRTAPKYVFDISQGVIFIAFSLISSIL